ncbi:nucleotidyltransferase domain-containing protein [Alkalihalobacillus macyae]|uniref:nucleotidyltransferase domain-containing protein n=1 Tax=Guptibacillus hwajinpoensis TaxID=208199 RepID=UPI00273B317A|nr:nucleotidyltransferase domain-containing protein [Alkalihalobacillus macyae]MDP4552634.1 nucleotidyltransferase domain-containing protein [Alkalihalobacillus macyae]
MHEHIIEVIKQTEKDHDIKILYACEAGSRAWGFPAEESDYDVRFIYIHKKNWYLSIDQKRDGIEVPSRDKVSIPVDDRVDMSGWELTKALKLFRKSNPPLLEWLHSTIVYHEPFSTAEQMRELARTIFSPRSCLYHYVNMAKGNFRECLKREDVRIKMYLNVLRPVLASNWIKKYQSIPPIGFEELFEDAALPLELQEVIKTFLKSKRAGEDLIVEPRIDVINSYVQKEVEELEAYAKALDVQIEDPTEKLNDLFRITLEEVWG